MICDFNCEQYFKFTKSFANTINITFFSKGLLVSEFMLFSCKVIKKLEFSGNG